MAGTLLTPGIPGETEITKRGDKGRYIC